MNGTLQERIGATALPLMLTLSMLTLAGPYAGADGLAVSASTPDVSISTRQAGRNFLRLPSLEYRFVIAAVCEVARTPVSLSLSVADTRVSVPASELLPDMPVQMSVTIPASQIGPIAVTGFCASDERDNPGDPQTSMRIPAVLSAQAALLCVSETSSQMTYASESLDVILHCQPPGETET